jgi:hypothetical protein
LPLKIPPEPCEELLLVAFGVAFAVGFLVAFGVGFLVVAPFAFAKDALRVVMSLVNVSTRACNSLDLA